MQFQTGLPKRQTNGIWYERIHDGTWRPAHKETKSTLDGTVLMYDVETRAWHPTCIVDGVRVWCEQNPVTRQENAIDGTNGAVREAPKRVINDTESEDDDDSGGGQPGHP